MVKNFIKIGVLALSVALFAGINLSYAETTTPDTTNFKSICEQAGKQGPWQDYPECVTSPSECKTNPKFNYPINCTFIEEPIGGEMGYDMFKVTCGIKDTATDKYVCTYVLWHGEAIISKDERVVQALLVYEPGKEYQGPFGLLYNYIGVVYKFLSGIIVAFVILVSIIGGIEMTTSGGDQEKFKKGRERIQKALVGMVLWFLASLVLYTINPTFFSF
jgi:hypothetical protein